MRNLIIRELRLLENEEAPDDIDNALNKIKSDVDKGHIGNVIKVEKDKTWGLTVKAEDRIPLKDVMEALRSWAERSPKNYQYMMNEFKNGTVRVLIKMEGSGRYMHYGLIKQKTYEDYIALFPKGRDGGDLKHRLDIPKK